MSNVTKHPSTPAQPGTYTPEMIEAIREARLARTAAIKRALLANQANDNRKKP